MSRVLTAMLAACVSFMLVTFAPTGVQLQTRQSVDATASAISVRGLEKGRVNERILHALRASAAKGSKFSSSGVTAVNDACRESVDADFGRRLRSLRLLSLRISALKNVSLSEVEQVHRERAGMAPELAVVLLELNPQWPVEFQISCALSAVRSPQANQERHAGAILTTLLRGNLSEWEKIVERFAEAVPRSVSEKARFDAARALALMDPSHSRAMISREIRINPASAASMMVGMQLPPSELRVLLAGMDVSAARRFSNSIVLQLFRISPAYLSQISDCMPVESFSAPDAARFSSHLIEVDGDAFVRFAVRVPVADRPAFVKDAINLYVQRCRSGIYSRPISLTPEAISRLGIELEDSDELRALISSRGEKDGIAVASQLVEALPSRFRDRLREEALIGAIRGMRRNGDQLSALAATLGGEELSKNAPVIASTWASIDYQSALRWAHSLSDASVKKTAIDEAMLHAPCDLRTLKQMCEDQLKHGIDQLPVKAYRRLIKETVAVDPWAAAELLQAVNGSEAQAGLAANLIEQWAAYDAWSASEWVIQMPVSKARPKISEKF